MNKFRNYLLTATGIVFLTAVVSGITAGPAIAQIVKAALVRNVDEPGRSPFLSSEQGGGEGCGGFNCISSDQFNGPAANTRLVIKDVSARVYLASGGKIFSAQLFSCPTPNTVCNAPPPGAAAINLPVSLQASAANIASGFPPFDVWVTNQQVQFYVEAGSVPQILFIMDSGETAPGAGIIHGSVSGYTVSLP
jgi:hypothetical protein